MLCVLSGSDKIGSISTIDCLKLLLVSAGSRRLSGSELQTVASAIQTRTMQPSQMQFLPQPSLRTSSEYSGLCTVRIAEKHLKLR